MTGGAVVLLDSEVVAPSLGPAELTDVSEARLEFDDGTVGSVVAVVDGRVAGEVAGRHVVESDEQLTVASLIADPGEVGVSEVAHGVANDVAEQGVGGMAHRHDSVVNGRTLRGKVARGADEVHAAVRHFLSAQPASVVGLHALGGVCGRRGRLSAIRRKPVGLARADHVNVVGMGSAHRAVSARQEKHRVVLGVEVAVAGPHGLGRVAIPSGDGDEVADPSSIGGESVVQL